MAEQATTLMKSRRRITAPKAQKHAENRLITSGIRDRRNGGQRSICAAKILNRQMSALGQKRTSEYVQAMSALPPKADIEASMSTQVDFQNCCSSETAPSNFYTRLPLPDSFPSLVCQGRGRGVSNAIADENADRTNAPSTCRLGCFCVRSPYDKHPHGQSTSKRLKLLALPRGLQGLSDFSGLLTRLATDVSHPFS